MPKISAGLLMFRQKNGQTELFLVHPGGPFFAKKDLAVWSIPKGEVEDGKELFDEALREFSEETGIKPPSDPQKYIHLGEAKQNSGKIVHVWAFEGDFEGQITCNDFEMEWPPKSGKMQKFPECDRAEFFSEEIARQKIVAGQVEFINRLVSQLSS